MERRAAEREREPGRVSGCAAAALLRVAVAALATRRCSERPSSARCCCSAWAATMASGLAISSLPANCDRSTVGHAMVNGVPCGQAAVASGGEAARAAPAPQRPHEGGEGGRCERRWRRHRGAKTDRVTVVMSNFFFFFAQLSDRQLFPRAFCCMRRAPTPRYRPPARANER